MRSGNYSQSIQTRSKANRKAALGTPAYLYISPPLTFKMTTAFPGGMGREKESPDLRHLLFLWCKYSHQSPILATNMTLQSTDLGVNKSVLTSWCRWLQHSTLVSPSITLFLVSPFAPLPLKFPKAYSLEQVPSFSFLLPVLIIFNFKVMYSFHNLINSLDCLSRKFHMYTQTLKSAHKCEEQKNPLEAMGHQIKKIYSMQ